MSRADDEATIGSTCSLLGFYQKNRTTLDQIAYQTYSSLCMTARNVGKVQAKDGSIREAKPPTLAECKDFYSELLPTLPVYKMLSINLFLTPAMKKVCAQALARYVVDGNWNDIIRHTPCLY